MSHDLLIAVSLILVLEGIIPFLSPKVWRDMMLRLTKGNDKSVRIMGLVSMLIGMVMIYYLRKF